jgi:hypothetical protein
MKAHVSDLSVFTKPWRDKTAEELALVMMWGLTQSIFPLRPGYQVDPEEAEKGLAALQMTLSAYGVHISSVDGNTAEEPLPPAMRGYYHPGVMCRRTARGVHKEKENKRGSWSSDTPVEMYGVTWDSHLYGVWRFQYHGDAAAYRTLRPGAISRPSGSRPHSALSRDSEQALVLSGTGFALST